MGACKLAVKGSCKGREGLQQLSAQYGACGMHGPPDLDTEVQVNHSCTAVGPGGTGADAQELGCRKYACLCSSDMCTVLAPSMCRSRSRSASRDRSEGKGRGRSPSPAPADGDRDRD